MFLQTFPLILHLLLDSTAKKKNSGLNHLKNVSSNISANFAFDVGLYMIAHEILLKLRSIGKKNGWSIIREVGEIYGSKVYELKRPEASGKIGYPHLYSVKNAEIVELNRSEIISVIKQDLFQRGGKLIQHIGVNT